MTVIKNTKRAVSYTLWGTHLTTTYSYTQRNKGRQQNKIQSAHRTHSNTHASTHTHSREHTRVMEKWLSLWLVPAAEGEATIANYLSLYTTAALAVRMPQHVSVCACVCVRVRHSGRDWQIASYTFQLAERGERKCRRGGGRRRRMMREVRGESLRRAGRNMQSEYKRKQQRDWWLYLTVAEKMGSRGATDLHWAGRWWQMSGDQDVADAAGPTRRWPQIEQTDKSFIIYEQCVAELWPVCGPILKYYMTTAGMTVSLSILSQTTDSSARTRQVQFTAAGCFLMTGQSVQINKAGGGEVKCCLSFSHNVGVRVFTACNFTIWVMVS